MKKAVISIIILFSAGTIHLFSQFFNPGASPGNVKWEQIKTAHFNLIYPVNFRNNSEEFANYLEQAIPAVSAGLNVQPKPIKIVLHNQNVLSNGYVAWAPKRMALISSPPQKSYPHNWLEQLTLHEYRHVAQMEKLDQGVIKTGKYFLGDLSVGLAAGIVPTWFFEGDAVFSETVHSSTGRGREPDFLQNIKAIENTMSKRYTYEQAYLGTYRTYAPDQYEYGYYMTSWARYKYGDDVWSNTLSNVSHKPFILAPFYFGLKKETGLSKSGLYNETFDSLKTVWQDESSQAIDYAAHDVPTFYKSDYVSYLYPYAPDDDHIIALRTSIDDIAKLVIIDSNSEKTLYTIGQFNGVQIAYSKQFIAWEELQYDLRWEQRNFSNIRVFNLETKKSFLLSSREKHFSPSISPSGEKIAVIKTDEYSNSYVEIYEIQTKYLIHRKQHPENYQLSYTSWLNDSVILMTALDKNGKSILSYSFKEEKWETLFGPTYQNISNVVSKDNALYFCYTYNGRTNIYWLDENLQAFQITHSKNGAAYASPDGNQLVFSEYSIKGYKIRKVNKDELKFVPLENIVPGKYFLADKLSVNRINLQTEERTGNEYPQKKYSKIAHALNFHSWIIPFHFSTEDFENINDISELGNQIKLGANLFSQNILGDITSSLGYYYSNGYNYFKPGVIIESFFPVIKLSADIGGPPFILKTFTEPFEPYEKLPDYLKVSGKLTFPFDLSTSRYWLGFSAGIESSFSNRSIASLTAPGTGYEYSYRQDSIYYYSGITLYDFQFALNLQTKKAYKNLYPRWGISVYLSFLKTGDTDPFAFNFESNVITSRIYLPGILKHHSFQFFTGLENGPASRLAPPRGYNRGETGRSKNMGRFNLSYFFPIAYPDFNIGPVLYIKRIKGGIIYDYAYMRGSSVMSDGYLQSLTTELSFDAHFLRHFWEFTPVFSYTYRINDGHQLYSFVLRHNFSFAAGNNF